MMASATILSPASGGRRGPPQDMVIGVYYLTTENFMAKGAGKSSRAPGGLPPYHAGVVTTQRAIQSASPASSST